MDAGKIEGRFHDFTLDEALAIAKRNDPGDEVPSVSRVLIAEINRLSAEVERNAKDAELWRTHASSFAVLEAMLTVASPLVLNRLKAQDAAIAAGTKGP